MAFSDDVKTYCCTDDDIGGYVDAAEAYLTNAGITVAEANPLYAIAVKMMVSYWYDNRVPSASTTDDAKQPYGLAGIMLQLQLSQGAG
jgi:uncharacterized phage protein (predicted DNA packaging)